MSKKTKKHKEKEITLEELFAKYLPALGDAIEGTELAISTRPQLSAGKNSNDSNNTGDGLDIDDAIKRIELRLDELSNQFDEAKQQNIEKLDELGRMNTRQRWISSISTIAAIAWNLFRAISGGQ
ncbi:MAG: hypothetical protein KDE53_07730 [Caldilineaceae bacterium]|nr:hypothetical protein [Caldilineaceae bacterium]